MPLQNRVTPFGEIVAIPQRGMFTGNRGIIHDPATKTLTNRGWTTRAWIICACQYKDIRREVMARRSWTELFFLDEAVALAAGHRPCFLCRRVDAERFRHAWAEGNDLAVPTAAALDSVLHGERLEKRSKRLHALPMPVVDLPDGAMVAKDGDAFVIAQGGAYRWTEAGYGPLSKLAAADSLITPPSTMRAMLAGYRPLLHHTIPVAG